MKHFKRIMYFHISIWMTKLLFSHLFLWLIFLAHTDLHLKLFKDNTTFRDVCGTCGFFGDARGRQCSFQLCLHPQGCLRRGPGIGFLSRARRRNRGLSARGTNTRLRLEFSRKTGLILRRAGKSLDDLRFSTKKIILPTNDSFIFSFPVLNFLPSFHITLLARTSL